MVKLHCHVRAQGPLDLDGALGGDRPEAAVDVAAELDAVLGDLAQGLEGEDLEAAGVGEHRAVPCREAVQAAEGLDHFLAGTEVQVVGVAQHDLRAGAADVVGMQAAHGAVRAHGHERRRLHRAVRQGERPRACGPRRGLEPEGEGRRHTITMASPYE